MFLGLNCFLKKSFEGVRPSIVIEVVLKEWPTFFLFILVLTKGVEYTVYFLFFLFWMIMYSL